MSSSEGALAVVEPLHGMRRAVEPHRVLIEQFAAGDISADQFEEKYLAQYKADSTHWDSAVFDILDGLFFDVDDYVGDADLRAEAGGLDRDELRARAQLALRKLDQYLA
jgi:hypothetical protein